MEKSTAQVEGNILEVKAKCLMIYRYTWQIFIKAILRCNKISPKPKFSPPY